MWYQHDGCPAHYGCRVIATLNEIFPNRRIGRGEPISWATRSPDITPLDFFLWGILKNIIYQEMPTTPENMKQQIIAACATISPQMLRSVFLELNDCSVALMQTDITSNTFDVRIIVLFLYLMMNDLLL